MCVLFRCLYAFLVAGHGNIGRCCRRGLDHIPNRVTCEQFAIQSVGEGYPSCRKAFQDCCERLVKSLPEDLHYFGLGQSDSFVYLNKFNQELRRIRAASDLLGAKVTSYLGAPLQQSHLLHTVAQGSSIKIEQGPVTKNSFQERSEPTTS